MFRTLTLALTLYTTPFHSPAPISRMVHTLPFGSTTVTAPGYGAMSLSGAYGPSDDGEAHKTLARAIELGCTFWDR